MTEKDKTLVRADVQAATKAEQGTLVRSKDAPEDAAGSTVVRSHPDATPTVVHSATPGGEEGPVTPETAGRYEVRSEYGRGGASRE